MYVHPCVLLGLRLFVIDKEKLNISIQIEYNETWQYCVSSFVPIVWTELFSVLAWQCPHWWSTNSSKLNDKFYCSFMHSQTSRYTCFQEMSTWKDCTYISNSSYWSHTKPAYIDSLLLSWSPDRTLIQHLWDEMYDTEYIIT